MMLILVLVVITLMSYAVYSFSSLMVIEYEAATMGLRQQQRRALASSGIEAAVACLRRESLGLPIPSKTNILAGPVNLAPEGLPAGTIAVFREIPHGESAPQFGLQDESSRLNLNSLPTEPSRRRESRQRLMALPGVTMHLADAILDWIDEDDDPSEFGAETEWYSGQFPPRKPRQGPLPDLHELLLVRGMTPELLYGHSHAAGFPASARSDSSGQRSMRNGTHRSPAGGLIQYLTVTGCESQRHPSGRRLINLNDPQLDRLFDNIASLLDTETATYVVAHRIFGATFLDAPRPDEGENAEQRRLERLESARRRLESQLGQFTDRRSTTSETPAPGTRGGMRLPANAPFRFHSLIDLFGGQVRATINSQDRLLRSPWPTDPASLRRLLPELELIFCLSDHEFHYGRININQATFPVLMTVPGMSEPLARSILAVRPDSAGRELPRQAVSAAAANAAIDRSNRDEFRSIAWLATRGLVNVGLLRQLAPYMTVRGAVHSGIAEGTTAGDVPAALIDFQAVLHGDHHRYLRFQDLSPMPAISRTAR